MGYRDAQPPEVSLSSPAKAELNAKRDGHPPVTLVWSMLLVSVLVFVTIFLLFLSSCRDAIPGYL